MFFSLISFNNFKLLSPKSVLDAGRAHALLQDMSSSMPGILKSLLSQEKNSICNLLSILFWMQRKHRSEFQHQQLRFSGRKLSQHSSGRSELHRLSGGRQQRWEADGWWISSEVSKQYLLLKIHPSGRLSSSMQLWVTSSAYQSPTYVNASLPLNSY